MKRSSHDSTNLSWPRRKPRFCGSLVRLPWKSYAVKEKSLKRSRTLRIHLTGEKASSPVEILGLVNMGPTNDEIWIERSLSEEEKAFVILHELVHARRQMSGEDLSDEGMEEIIVELEAIARADPISLGALPNGMALRVLHDFLTSFGEDDPNTSAGLAEIHRRIRLLLGGRRTMACPGGD